MEHSGPHKNPHIRQSFALVTEYPAEEPFNAMCISRKRHGLHAVKRKKMNTFIFFFIKYSAIRLDSAKR